MPKSSFLERILSQTKDKEKKYDWLGAVEFYNKASAQVLKQKDFLKAGDVQERISHCFYRAAFQAESQEEFKERMQRAVDAYEKAHGLYDKLADEPKVARIFRCEAMIAYMSYWLASEVPEKRRLLDECWRLTKECLKAFEEAGDAWEYGKTYNQLSTSLDFRFCLEWGFQVREKMMREAVERGEQTITFLSTIKDSHELARAYVKTANYLEVFGFYFLKQDDRKTYLQKAKDYWQKAYGLSEETAVVQLLSVLEGGLIENWGHGTDKTLTLFGKALEYSRRMKDKFIIGCALDALAYHTSWRMLATEDPDERMKLAKKALQYAKDAKHQFSLISFVSPRDGVLWAEAPHAQYYALLARDEANANKKRKLLEKALEAAPDGLKRAEGSGYAQMVTLLPRHVFSGILVSLAKIETNSEEKKRLLQKALEHRTEAIRLADELEPYEHWDLGVIRVGRAEIKSELSRLAKDPEAKERMLREADQDTENSLKLMIKGAQLFEKEGTAAMFAHIGRRQYRHGELLNRLYECTNNGEHLRKAAAVFSDAAESFRRPGLKSRMAECFWKAAQVYDRLGDHLKAADNFEHAENHYRSAAESIPQLKAFYQAHVLYMQAWSEIEKARHHHRRQEYGLAKEHFEKAANIHNSLEQWNYLAPNYAAWAQLEQAEALSRKEESEEAIQAFGKAAKLFKETKKSLKNQLKKIEEPDEKHMVTNLVRATDLRYEYCIGRVELEEAKILDRKGDHYSSSEKYRSAAEIFEKMIQALESEQDQKEIRLIITLSRAWQKMTRAEAETSPDIYLEASQLFEEAKEHSLSEKVKTLALGHSRFCRALEAGTRFEESRDTPSYSTAKKHLEAASNCYLKAGFKTASEYARATHRLLDGYMHIHKAETESEPMKKAQYYQLAEKLLQASAGSFMKAKHPEKKEQVQRLLESVKEEQELVTSLADVLLAPPITSTTTSFATPTPTHEQAVGLERFEHADIQANLIVRVKEVKVGEDIHLALELVNAGKAPASLIKVDAIVPEGFEIGEVPEIYRVEDSYLNMKGKRLNPLKTEDVKLIVKPKSKGTFRIKPRILYIDETGKYKSHEPEPVTVIVEELGVKDWIKGEG